MSGTGYYQKNSRNFGIDLVEAIKKYLRQIK